MPEVVFLKIRQILIVKLISDERIDIKNYEQAVDGAIDKIKSSLDNYSDG